MDAFLDDEHAANELTLHIDNTYRFYQTRRAIERALARRLAKRTYDPAKGPKAFRYLVDEAARSYSREYADGVADAKRLFPGSLRDKVAQTYAERFERAVAEERWGDLPDEAARLLRKPEAT